MSRVSRHVRAAISQSRPRVDSLGGQWRTPPSNWELELLLPLIVELLLDYRREENSNAA